MEAYILGIWILGSLVQAEFITDYMTLSCGKLLSPRVSGRLETTTSLTYDDNMDCQTTISVADDKLIRLVMKRFEVEDPSGGNCLDYLNVYDGINSDFPVLIYRLCGADVDEFVFNTSSNHVTFRFLSDDTAVYRGFEVEYTAYSLPPCVSGEFECGIGICIDEGNTCDDVNQCGDYTDETDCPDTDQAPDDGTTLDLPLIVGATLGGLALLIILIVIIIKVYYYIKWKLFMKKHDRWTMEDLYEYPVTDQYNKHNIGHKGRRQQRNVTFFDNPLSYTDNDVKDGVEEL